MRRATQVKCYRIIKRILGLSLCRLFDFLKRHQIPGVLRTAEIEESSLLLAQGKRLR